MKSAQSGKEGSGKPKMTISATWQALGKKAID